MAARRLETKRFHLRGKMRSVTMATVDALHDILCARNERTVAMETDRERDREERESVDPDSWREREKQGRIHGIRHLFSPLKRRRYRPTDGWTDGRTDRWTDGQILFRGAS